MYCLISLFLFFLSGCGLRLSLGSSSSSLGCLFSLQPLSVDTLLFLLQLAQTVALSIAELLFFTLFVHCVSWQTFSVKLSILTVLMSREDFKPFSTWSGLFLQLEFLLSSLGLLSFAYLVQLGLSFSQKLVLVRELPNGRLVLLPVFKLNSHKR